MSVMVVQKQALKSFSNCQNNHELFVLFSFNFQHRWKLLPSSLAFICEFDTESPDPTFRNKDEAFDKTADAECREFCL